MSSDLLLIDMSNTNNKMYDDVVTVRFKNEEDLQVNFSKLVQQSKYVRDNYAYTDFVECVEFEVDKIESTTSISEGSIREFLELVQAGRARIAVEHYRDIYALSEHFGAPNVRQSLDSVLESNLCRDVGFSIGVLVGSSCARDSAETALARKVERFLSGRLSECLSHAKFGDLPVSTVYRIVSESGEDGIDHDRLLDFVLSSAEKRQVLLNLVVPHRLSDGGLSSLVGFICAQEGESASKLSGFLRFDIDLVRVMKRQLEESEAKKKEATEELKEERARHENTKKELKEERAKHESTKKELKEERAKHESTKKELKEERARHENTKKELKEERAKHESTKEELNEERARHENTKKELKEERAKHESTKEELNEERANHKSTKEEQSKSESRFKHLEEETRRAKSEKEQHAQAIVAGGFNGNGGLGEKSNSKTPDGDPIISPPAKLPLDPSSLLSYSANNRHSVAVTNEGSLLGVGLKCRISSSLSGDASHFTEFSISDSSGGPLDPVSAVCTVFGTLYMLAKRSEKGRQLVFCDESINGGRKVFLDIGDHEPVALFGGYSHAAAICEEGEVIFINRDSIKKSPGSRIEASRLPGGEKASSVACCSDSVVALSASGRVFGSGFRLSSSVLAFTEVAELSGKEIVCVSGTHDHCLAVSKEGRVFGRGSNSHGQLGLGRGTGGVSSFTEISSLGNREIRSASAGCWHSLFETREGKILSCGSNKVGQLLLSGGLGDTVYSPAEAAIAGCAGFCTVGRAVSAVFVGRSAPPNAPNMRVDWHE